MGAALRSQPTALRSGAVDCARAVPAPALNSANAEACKVVPLRVTTVSGESIAVETTSGELVASLCKEVTSVSKLMNPECVKLVFQDTDLKDSDVLPSGLITCIVQESTR